MSDEPSPTPEDILDDLALRHALGTLDSEERAQFEACLGSPNSRAAALAAEYRDVVASVTLAALPDAVPSARVKERVLATIRSQKIQSETKPVPAHASAMIRAVGDMPWMATPYRGVRIRELSTASPDYSVIMLSCDAGATFPPHDHAGEEDVYILSGDATIDGRVLRAGDFMHAEPGSHHEDMISRSGCQALIITSRKNYSPRAARAYDMAHRVVSRIGKAIGVKSRG
ncbi:cupin domain-containing protein [Prosthecobacter sp.]|uniref:cupin domain-containing protein n=1 Tax=Prosthecobacter sp. TaxID=1965333 RepID=UPI001DE0A7AA|nr:cupin domain-containing protein [Prosthecobacter sp.]MCB1276321.1 cupin domain-containing protein [Prosthecobacter sp.]